MTIGMDNLSTETRSLQEIVESPTIVPNGRPAEKHHYYIAYQHKNGFGRCFINRDTPLDSEKAILDAHISLERQLGFCIVILNWKRID